MTVESPWEEMSLEELRIAGHESSAQIRINRDGYMLLMLKSAIGINYAIVPMLDIIMAVNMVQDAMATEAATEETKP